MTKLTQSVEANRLISTEPVEYRVALLHLGKGELVETRPDLKREIEQLQDTDIEAIALQAEAALQAIYTIVLNITLMSYLTNREPLPEPPA